MYDYIYTYKGEQYGTSEHILGRLPIICIAKDSNGLVYGFTETPTCITEDGEKFWVSEKFTVELHHITTCNDVESSLEFI